MPKGIVIITGVGMNEAKKEFKTPDPARTIPGHTPGKKAKINSPAGSAVELNKNGYIIYMLGECNNCLSQIGKELLSGEYYYKSVDLMDSLAVKEVVKEVAELKAKKNLQVHLVHYGGMSGKAAKVKLEKETVALSPWEIPPNSLSPYIEANCSTLLSVLHELKDVFSSQEVSKVVIISAISAIRTKRLHTLDALQKSAVHAMARSMALDLTKEKIYITEVMPGITDTGFYDNDETLKAMILASKELGYEYDENTFPVFSAQKVGKAVLFAIDTEAHVREISLMPYGQYPHLGA